MLYYYPTVGNLVGPQTFRAEQAPEYSSGVAAMLTCYCLVILLIGGLWGYCAWLNRRKTALRKEQAHEATNDLVEEWHDLTDQQNPRFVYVT